MVALCFKLLALLTFGLVHGSLKPLIFISGPRIGVEYHKIQLQCITSAADKKFVWHFSPNGTDIQYQPLNPSSTVRLLPNGTLIIRSVDKIHVGRYRCCGSENVCANINLFVLSATDDDSSLRLTNNAAANSALLDVPSHGSFSLAIYHASFNGEVYMDREATVGICKHFLKHAKECSEARSSDAVAYTVRNGTMEDSGQFDIKVIFNQQLERFHLHILIRGSPIVRMNNYSVLKNSTHINLQCRGDAYPTPNITFTYTPCNPMIMDHLHRLQKSRCDESTSVSQHLERRSPFNYTTKFEVVVPGWPIVKGPGIISCHAGNSEGTTVTETFLYVRNFLEPMVFNVVSPTDVVLYDDTVHMTCQVDVYNFTNQLIIEHGGSSSSLTGQRFHYAWGVTYQAHITNASQNHISCTAHHKNGTSLVNTLHLSIQYPSKPHVVSGKVTVNYTIAFGDQFRLECDIDGTPTPDIVWFKNDEHLRNQQGHVILVSLESEEMRATYKCLGSSRLGRATKTWNIVVEDTTQWLLICGLGTAIFAILLLIGSIAWSVAAYQKLLENQKVLEEQLTIND